MTHIIVDGVVINTVMATVGEAKAAFPEATCIEATEGGIGWSWWTDEDVGEGELLPPPEAKLPVPTSITPRQGYIILSRYGLLESVRTYFAALEGQEGEEAKIELEFAQEWKRTWPTLINAAHDFGLTDPQIDQMFIEASII